MLQTPTAVMTCESPENMRARAKARGYQNGTQYGSLESQINYDPRFKGLLPTPMSVEVHHKERTQRAIDQGQTSFRGRPDKGKDTHPSGLMDYLQFKGLFPTPTAQDFKKRGPNSKQQGIGEVVRKMLPTPTARDEKNPSCPNGKRLARKKEKGWTIELNDLAGMGMLPTPSARDYKPPYNPEAMVRKDGMVRDDMLSSLPTMLGLKDRGGITFRLSPLFTEEMMGFPLGWTELPFLSTSGEQNPSKPTETP